MTPEQYQEQDRIRQDNRIIADKLIEKAAKAAKMSDYRKATNEMQNLRMEWRTTANPLPRESSDMLWEKFNGIINEFFEKAEKDCKQKAEDLIKKAEALSVSTEWSATSSRYSKLREQWRELFPLPKDEKESLYQRFNEAVNKFYTSREQELIETVRGAAYEAEQLADSTDYEHAERRIVSLGHRIENLHPVPEEEKKAAADRVSAAFEKLKMNRTKYEISNLEQKIADGVSRLDNLEQQLELVANDNFIRRDQIENMIDELDRELLGYDDKLRELKASAKNLIY